MNVGSLFSGIGGIDLGLERAGMRVVWQAESDAWCRGILARHWPGVPCYDDVRSLVADPAGSGHPAQQRERSEPSRIRTADSACPRHSTRLPVRVPRVDVLAGGFPCQPVSLAGKGLAQADERWLWPEFARLIRVLRPRYVIAENVPGLLARGLDIVLADLAALRFDAEWTVFGARDVGAPHRRDRVWIVAWDTDPDLDGREGLAERYERSPGRLEASLGHDADGLRLALSDADRSELRLEPGRSSGPSGTSTAVAGDDGSARAVADAPHIGHERPGPPRNGRDGSPHSRLDHHSWAVEPDVGRVAHGIPNRVDRLRALGNAVVPACAEHIGRLVIRHYHSTEGRLSPDPVTDQEHS